MLLATARKLRWGKFIFGYGFVLGKFESWNFRLVASQNSIEQRVR